MAFLAHDSHRLGVVGTATAECRFEDAMCAAAKELFYVGLDGRLMAVPIALGGNQPEIGAATALFTTRLGGAVQGLFKQQYIVSADGQRFLVNAVADAAASPINVLLNWKSGS